MGNTSVKTAWSPRFLRLDGAVSAWRNSRYEFVCNSIRFGGAMISLILPKLIRSVTRDGILTFYIARRQRRAFFFSKRHKASTLCSRELAGQKPLRAAS